jgi:hypothetical protein
MGKIPSLSVVALLLFVPACDQLFPELVGGPYDSAVATDGGVNPNMIAGSVCPLSDLRSPTSCAGVAAGRHITIEENRASADVDVNGKFTISLEGVTTGATFAVSDATMTGLTTPTVTYASAALLAAALPTGITLPCVSSQALSQIELQAGAPADPTSGALLGWLFDTSGHAVGNASASMTSAGVGPFYDGSTVSELDPGVATGAYGTLAFFDLPAGSAQLTVTTAPYATVAGDTFTLPIRGGAITAAALSLPARQP